MQQNICDNTSSIKTSSINTSDVQVILGEFEVDSKIYFDLHLMVESNQNDFFEIEFLNKESFDKLLELKNLLKNENVVTIENAEFKKCSQTIEMKYEGKVFILSNDIFNGMLKDIKEEISTI